MGSNPDKDMDDGLMYLLSVVYVVASARAGNSDDSYQGCEWMSVIWKPQNEAVWDIAGLLGHRKKSIILYKSYGNTVHFL